MEVVAWQTESSSKGDTHMHPAKRFFYVSLGILALAVAFQLGARTARGQGGSFVKVSDAPPGASDASPSFSPDGNTVAFLRQTGGSFEIRATSVAGGPGWLIAAVLAGWDCSGGSFEWSPRGDKMALFSGPTNATGVYVLDVSLPVPTTPTTWGRIKAERR